MCEVVGEGRWEREINACGARQRDAAVSVDLQPSPSPTLLHTPNVSASPLEPSVVAGLSTSPAGNPVLPMHMPAVLSSPAVCGHELFRLALAIPALDSVLSALPVVGSNPRVFQLMPSSCQHTHACSFTRSCPPPGEFLSSPVLQSAART